MPKSVTNARHNKMQEKISYTPPLFAIKVNSCLKVCINSELKSASALKTNKAKNRYEYTTLFNLNYFLQEILIE